MADPLDCSFLNASATSSVLSTLEPSMMVEITTRHANEFLETKRVDKGKGKAKEEYPLNSDSYSGNDDKNNGVMEDYPVRPVQSTSYESDSEFTSCEDTTSHREREFLKRRVDKGKGKAKEEYAAGFDYYIGEDGVTHQYPVRPDGGDVSDSDSDANSYAAEHGLQTKDVFSSCLESFDHVDDSYANEDPLKRDRDAGRLSSMMQGLALEDKALPDEDEGFALRNAGIPSDERPTGSNPFPTSTIKRKPLPIPSSSTGTSSPSSARHRSSASTSPFMTSYNSKYITCSTSPFRFSRSPPSSPPSRPSSPRYTADMLQSIALETPHQQSRRLMRDSRAAALRDFDRQIAKEWELLASAEEIYAQEQADELSFESANAHTSGFGFLVGDSERESQERFQRNGRVNERTVVGMVGRGARVVGTAVGRGVDGLIERHAGEERAEMVRRTARTGVAVATAVGCVVGKVGRKAVNKGVELVPVVGEGLGVLGRALDDAARRPASQ